MSAVAPEKSESGRIEGGAQIIPEDPAAAGRASADLALAAKVEPAIPGGAAAVVADVEDHEPSTLETTDLPGRPAAEAHVPSGGGPGVKALVREFGKAVVRGLATLVILPLLVTYRLRSLVLGRNRALEGSTQLLSLIPGILGQYLRRAFLARVIERCHETATIEFGTIFSQTGARIDEYAYVGPRCHLGLAHIEHDALVAAGVHVPSGARTHGTASLGRSIREQDGARTPVRIGAGSWIGSAAIVMADVGRDTVVGAGAVVTKPLPDRVIAGGVPARVIRSRTDELSAVSRKPSAASGQS